MLSVKSIQDVLIYPFPSEKELLLAIDEVFKGFTTSRENIESYLKSERLVSAYSIFYFLTNISKLDHVFKRIGFDLNSIHEYEFVDIGTGPGTFLYSLLAIDPSLTVQGIEKSEVMIKQANIFLKHFYPDSNFSISKDKVLPKQKKRMGIFGHSANEMTKSEVLAYIDKLELDEVLFIEPGTKDFFQNKAIPLRDSLLDQFQIAYPCPSQGPCQMDKGNWCHQYLYIKQEPSVERLCQMLKKNRKLLPLTIHYYKKESSPGNAILVQKKNENKAMFEWQVCQKENELVEIEFLKRNLSKKEVKNKSHTLLGEFVHYEKEKDLSESKVRGSFLTSSHL